MTRSTLQPTPIGPRMVKSRPTSTRRIEDLCATHGLRMTEQRRTIARVLDETADHPDVEEVHRRASLADAQISMSTV